MIKRLNKHHCKKYIFNQLTKLCTASEVIYCFSVSEIIYYFSVSEMIFCLSFSKWTNLQCFIKWNNLLFFSKRSNIQFFIKWNKFHSSVSEIIYCFSAKMSKRSYRRNGTPVELNATSNVIWTTAKNHCSMVVKRHVMLLKHSNILF